MGDTLRILTYNIHKGFSAGNRRFVLHQIKSQLQKTGVDVVLLQEVQGQHHIKHRKIKDWPETNQLEFLADSLWPHHAYGKNAIYNAGHHGNAILSRYPFIHWENINVAFMKSASRSLLHGVIRLPQLEQPVHVICVHLGLFSLERRWQLKKLVSRLNQHVPDNEPLVIAGDFNDWQGRSGEYLSHELGLSEVFKSATGKHEATFPALFPFLRMDRVYVRGCSILSQQKLHQGGWRELSDHLPLLVELGPDC